jgi:hypothetical protein
MFPQNESSIHVKMKAICLTNKNITHGNVSGENVKIAQAKVLLSRSYRVSFSFNLY